MIRELMKKIDIEGDPALSGLYSDMIPAKVEIITEDGKTFAAEECYPKGFPKNPMSDEELNSKFESLCAYVFGKGDTGRLREMIMRMESLKDILGITELMVKR
jgi:2-methylcitrate dehydratase